MNEGKNLKNDTGKDVGSYVEKKVDVFKIIDDEKRKIMAEMEENFKKWTAGEITGLGEVESYLISEFESGDIKEEDKETVEEYINSVINLDIWKKYSGYLSKYDEFKKNPAKPRSLGAAATKTAAATIYSNSGENSMEKPIALSSSKSVDQLLAEAEKKQKRGDSQPVLADKGKPENSEKKKADKKKTGEKKAQPVSGSRGKKLGEGGLADLGKIELKEPIDSETKDFIDSMFEAMGANASAINSVKKLLEGRMVNMDEDQKNAILKYVDEKNPKDNEAKRQRSAAEKFLKENDIKIKEGTGLPKKECIFYNQSNPKELFYIYSVEDGGKIRIWDRWEESGSEEDDETIIKEGFSYITLEELKKRMETYRQGENGEGKFDEQTVQEAEKAQKNQKAQESAVQNKAGKEISAEKFFEKYGNRYGEKFFPEKDFGSWMIVSGFDEKKETVNVSFEYINKKSGKTIRRREKLSVAEFEEIIKKYSLPEEEMKKKKDEREKSAGRQVKQKADNEQKKGVMTKDEFGDKFKHIFGKNLFKNGEENGDWMYVKNDKSYKENAGEVKILVNGKAKKITLGKLEEMLEIYKAIERKSEDAGQGEMTEEEAEKLIRELNQKFLEEDFKKIDFGQENEMTELKTKLMFLDKDLYEKMEEEAYDLFFTYRDEVMSKDISWKECYKRLSEFKPKVDNFWSRLGKKSEENKNKTEDKIKKSGNFQDLFEAIDRTGGIPGVDKYYYSEELKITINNIRQGNLGIDSVPETIGLRDKVNELLEKKKGKVEVLLEKETMEHFLEFARKFDEQCRALKWEGYENDMDIVDRAIKIEMKKFLRKSVKEIESDEKKQEKIIEFILNSFKK